MKFLEKDLEDIIYENANSEVGKKLLSIRGLPIKGLTYRQVDFGDYGKADLVNLFITPSPCKGGLPKRYFTIIELKKGKVCIDAVLQAHRYKTALEEHINNSATTRPFDDIIRVVIIGDSVDTESDIMLLYNNLPDTRIYTYEYRLEGLFFRLQTKGWIKPSANLSEDTSSSLEKCPGFRELRKAYVKDYPTKIELPF